MAPSTSTAIPSFYRIFFPSIDPLIALSGAFFAYFQPDVTMSSMFPLSHAWARITPAHTMLLQQLGGWYISVIFLQVFLLRYTQDVNIWKLFQFSVLITDAALFQSLWVALKAQERLQIEKVRPEEWGTAAITGFVAVVRILFLAGVGFGKKGGGIKKRN
ncbi:hypothetical protein K505DRAFT_306063 [Melanomma pulvis-pyrius CBS 109.77]|uniref:DUF7704 domain-containing protein n=1 Tax=Melanomma pulvis-pyrius CBS 109.77 TaxID=1314802 RepID=A0A6A6XAV3_9PLEO|nr:hypothetical protein K505DRAFT_306063 [Melanomma pulvis-pyrius CBS 109.77]